MKSSKHQTPGSREAPSPKLSDAFAALRIRGRRVQSQAQEFKKGAGTATSPRLVSSMALYGEEPRPRSLTLLNKPGVMPGGDLWKLQFRISLELGAWNLEFGIC